MLSAAGVLLSEVPIALERRTALLLLAAGQGERNSLNRASIQLHSESFLQLKPGTVIDGLEGMRLVNLTEDTFIRQKAFERGSGPIRGMAFPPIFHSFPVKSPQQWTMLQSEQSQYFNTPKAEWGGQWNDDENMYYPDLSHACNDRYSPETLGKAADIFRNVPVSHCTQDLAVNRGQQLQGQLTGGCDFSMWSTFCRMQLPHLLFLWLSSELHKPRSSHQNKYWNG